MSSLAGLVPRRSGHYKREQICRRRVLQTLRTEVKPFGIKVAMIGRAPSRRVLRATARPAHGGVRGVASAQPQDMKSFEVRAPGPDWLPRP